MAATRAAKNRSIRQEALREQLANQGHLQHVIEIAKEIHEQAPTIEQTHLQALKTVADLKMKLVDKYLPSLKATELTTLDQDGQVTGFSITFKDATEPKPAK